jgi:hypothetical protein
MLDLQTVLLALLVMWTAVAFAMFWRLTNSAGKWEWAAKTTEPEASIAKLKNERDEARAVASRMRADLEARNGNQLS